MGILFYTVRT